MKENNMSANQFFNRAIDESLNPKHPILFFSSRTFFRKYKHYMTTQILSTVEDQGIAVGTTIYC